jgi:hypothetical protein
MSSQNQMFASNIYLSAELTNKMVSIAQDLACRVVRECGNRYNFDSDEAIRELGLASVEVVRSVKSQKKKLTAVVVEKASFPLPFNGECRDDKCSGLRQNNGLYTQCQVARKGEKSYCKTCQAQASKNVNGKPDYGTIQDRLAVGIFDFVDPRGNKPVGYKKIMKKYKLNEEQVLEEAGKLNIIINPEHFLEVEEVKKGRKPNPLKEAKVKAEGKKGRPKKTKKVLEIEGESEDLFANLVASATYVEEVFAPVTTPILAKKSLKSEEEKEAEKAEKEAKLAAKKVEKEAKLAADKAEKEAKLAADKAEKEAKLAAEKAEKEAKKEAEKAEKEAKAKEAAENKAKAAKKKPSSPKKEEPEEEEEADRVKKIEYEGKKYLKSKKTGIVYDYKKYVEEEEQVVVGKWNEEKSKIDFQEEGEEEEEEYDE